MSEMIQPGRYPATVKEWGFGRTGKGDYQIAIAFELIDHPGRRLTYFGGFSERQAKHTLNALRACGWRGENLANLAAEGMGSQEVNLTVEHEEYNGQVQVRVKWVNPPGFGLKNPVEGQELLEFARSMVGFIRSENPATATQQRTSGAQQQANAAAQRADQYFNGGGNGSNYGAPPQDDIPFARLDF